MILPDLCIELANDSGFEVPITEENILSCVQAVSLGEKKSFSLVEVCYVDAEGIIEINTKHLNRTYITDIITFDYTDSDDDTIEGTLYCCAPRIIEQAAEFNEPEEREFNRIIIHGLLHLCGYLDDTKESKAEMTRLEELYLERISL